MTISSSSSQFPIQAHWRRDLLLLTLGFGALYFFLLGRPPLANPDEGRYAEIPREMIERGDYVTPKLNGVNYFEKPPLMYWAVAASMRVFGPSEWAVRLAPALSGLGGVLLTYAAARRLHGRTAGMASAVVLGTSLIFFALSRILILDMAVSVLMCATLFCFILGVREPVGSRRRWLFYGLYASAALATLTKGLIGFLVTGAVMFLWLLIFNQWKRLRPLHLPTGVLLFLAIAAPWHILAAQRNEAWAQFYFIHEHWERFTTTTHGRYEPWWYFLPFVVVGLFPWIGFLPAGLREALAGGWARRRENADSWFLVIWAMFVLLFFSKSQSKLIPYILPLFPPLAVIVGSWLARRWEEKAVKPLRVGLNLFGFVSGLLAAALLVMVLKPEIVRDATQAAELKPFAAVAAVVLLIGGVGTLWLAQQGRARAALGTMVGAMAGFYLLLGAAVASIQKPGTKELAAITTAQAKPADRIYHYHEFFHDFVFYTRREVGTVGYRSELELEIDPVATASGRFIDDAEFRRQWTEAGRIFAVARKRDVTQLFADPGFRYHLLGESRGHYLFSNQP